MVVISFQTNPNTKAEELLKPFAVPFILMLTAYIVGALSLWHSDATKEAKKRAGRIFLYLDAAYGLYPQIGASLITSAWSYDPASVSIIAPFSFWISWSQLIIYLTIIPAELFRAVGYTHYQGSAVPDGEEHTESLVSSTRRGPPKWKYRLCILIVLPMISVLVGIGLISLAAALRPIAQLLLG